MARRTSRLLTWTPSPLATNIEVEVEEMVRRIQPFGKSSGTFVALNQPCSSSRSQVMVLSIWTNSCQCIKLEFVRRRFQRRSQLVQVFPLSQLTPQRLRLNVNTGSEDMAAHRITPHSSRPPQPQWQSLLTRWRFWCFQVPNRMQLLPNTYSQFLSFQFNSPHFVLTSNSNVDIFWSSLLVFGRMIL